MARAARRYLTARAALETAGAAELLACAVDVDVAYHALVRAAGLRCADVGCHGHHDDDDVPAVVDTPPL
jgi:hypothetical protein